MLKEEKINAAFIYVPETAKMNEEKFEVFHTLLRCNVIKHEINVGLIGISATLETLDDVSSQPFFTAINIVKIPQEVIDNSIVMYQKFIKTKKLPELFKNYTKEDIDIITILFKK